ncbi:hypothetical protein HNQ60_002912 [Povalibacter uvarum]|uniref:Uncharacterized protein n=1 Tax=Povalibacter uvarum TaxID=732238 RepID=A0A841HLE7_9GAMM|nr:hypothetical protein [Povalibacter uvarum]MBB6094031.1 hypothetical protein [Povalibacter uvarum]
MKGVVRLLPLALCSCLQAAPNPGEIRIVNLGSRSVSAFTLVGYPFRDVGLDRRPGEVLTPAFGTDSTTLELYWKLDDGTVHGQELELSDHIPPDSDNDPIVVGIHDDGLSVTWAKVDPLWIKYSRTGNPGIYPPPTVPYYLGCHGRLLEHPLAKEAWSGNAQELLDRDSSALVDEHRCSLGWYIPRSNRTRSEPDEQTARRLRAEWQAQIEAYKKQQRE